MWYVSASEWRREGDVVRPYYDIRHAESKDGLEWVRQDTRAGLEPSSAGWGSEMLCYPFVFDHAGHRYLLYNGNDYGRTGIGLAEEEG